MDVGAQESLRCLVLGLVLTLLTSLEGILVSLLQEQMEGAQRSLGVLSKSHSCCVEGRDLNLGLCRFWSRLVAFPGSPRKPPNVVLTENEQIPGSSLRRHWCSVASPGRGWSELSAFH